MWEWEHNVVLSTWIFTIETFLWRSFSLWKWFQTMARWKRRRRRRWRWRQQRQTKEKAVPERKKKKKKLLKYSWHYRVCSKVSHLNAPFLQSLKWARTIICRPQKICMQFSIYQSFWQATSTGFGTGTSNKPLYRYWNIVYTHICVSYYHLPRQQAINVCVSFILRFLWILSI